MIFLLSRVFSFLSVVILTAILRNLAVEADICDNPTDDALKIHKDSILLIGGVGMLIASLIGSGAMSPSVIEAVRRRVRYIC